MGGLIGFIFLNWQSSSVYPLGQAADGLHMNDWSYACLAKALGMAIAEAATRPTATAIGPSAAPR